jgi:hypothetical protein
VLQNFLKDRGKSMAGASLVASLIMLKQHGGRKSITPSKKGNIIDLA